MERGPGGEVRRPRLPPLLLAALALAVAGVLYLVLRAPARAATIPPGDWPAYGRDRANTKYSPLDQINRENFAQLRVAWRWPSLERELLTLYPDLRTGRYEATPLAVDGRLYVSTSISQVAALDPATGKLLWQYDPGTAAGFPPPVEGFVHRGVAFWRGRRAFGFGEDRRILFGTGDGFLIALDAETGRPAPGFGSEGRVDLTQGLRRPIPDRRLYGVTSPPVVCGDVVVVGSCVVDYALPDVPPGDVRGFDVRTGKPLWTFHTIPQRGEFGNDTWGNDSWQRAGGANVWSIMSCDPELDYVYLPVGTPSNDHYGGDRPGDNLFGDSLVCLEAKTGRRVWHFQMVHHGLWDYDLPCAPNLIDVVVDGRPVKAVAQVTKQAFCYVFDRVTGKPLWPIEERPVPRSVVPGEQTSPTQPFPTKPPPFDRQGLSKDDVIDLTPALRKEASAALRRFEVGPLFTPPALKRPAVVLPGLVGGASWAGAAFDPETRRLYVPSVTHPFAVQLFPLPKAASGSSQSPISNLQSPLPRYAGRVSQVMGPQGLPLVNPPWARLTALDMDRGERLWSIPLGEGPRQHPALRNARPPAPSTLPHSHTPTPPYSPTPPLPDLGWPCRGQVLVTPTLLLVAQDGVTLATRQSSRGYSIEYTFASYQPSLRAYDKRTGEFIGQIPLPNNASGAPMTCAVGGKQFIILPTGGANLPAELVALSLP